MGHRRCGPWRRNAGRPAEPVAPRWLRFVKLQRIRARLPHFGPAPVPCCTWRPRHGGFVLSNCGAFARSALHLSYPHDPDRSPRRPARWLRFVEMQRIGSIAPSISSVCTGQAARHRTPDRRWLASFRQSTAYPSSASLVCLTLPYRSSTPDADAKVASFCQTTAHSPDRRFASHICAPRTAHFAARPGGFVSSK